MKLFLVALLAIAVVMAALIAPDALRDSTLAASLDSTRIKRLWLKDVPAEEAVAGVLDELHAQHPSLQHVRFKSHFTSKIIDSGPTPDPLTNRVSVEFSDLTATDALARIADLCSVRYIVRGGGVHFYDFPRGYSPPAITAWDHVSEYALDVYWTAYNWRAIISNR